MGDKTRRNHVKIRYLVNVNHGFVRRHVFLNSKHNNFHFEILEPLRKDVDKKDKTVIIHDLDSNKIIMWTSN